MTDREILEMLLKEVTEVKKEVTEVKKDVTNLKRKLTRSTAELKAMDEMILDEVERVHSVLDKHKENIKVHLS